VVQGSFLIFDPAHRSTAKGPIRTRPRGAPAWKVSAWRRG